MHDDGWPGPAELQALVSGFRARTLSTRDWTHAAHLAVGTWHVAGFGQDEALALLRPGIKQLNLSLGGVNDDAHGYHETITRAYVTLIARFVDTQRASTPQISADALARTVIGSPLADRDVLLRFYSRERLYSVPARLGWLEPDLGSLSLSPLGVS